MTNGGELLCYSLDGYAKCSNKVVCIIKIWTIFYVLSTTSRINIQLQRCLKVFRNLNFTVALFIRRIVGNTCLQQFKQGKRKQKFYALKG